MTNPLVFNVADLIHAGPGLPEQRRQVGPAPSRIGPEMIAFEEGTTLTVEATLTQLGSAIMVDADVTGQLTGQCVRCLTPLTPETTVTINEVYGIDDSFVTSSDGDDDDADDDVAMVDIATDTIDIEQAVVDEAGLEFPFNPTCEGGCPEDEDNEVPAPDGVVGDHGRQEGATDPRWAGLEKFL